MSQKAAYPYDLSNSGGSLLGGYFNSSNPGFVRKVQSDFGWDWGIGLVPCGIWGNIRLVKGGIGLVWNYGATGLVRDWGTRLVPWGINPISKL